MGITEFSLSYWYNIADEHIQYFSPESPQLIKGETSVDKRLTKAASSRLMRERYRTWVLRNFVLDTTLTGKDI